jgi:hypothetical protein
MLPHDIHMFDRRINDNDTPTHRAVGWSAIAGICISPILLARSHCEEKIILMNPDSKTGMVIRYQSVVSPNSHPHLQLFIE